MGSTSSLSHKRFSRPREFLSYLSWVETEHKNFLDNIQLPPSNENHHSWAKWLRSASEYDGIDDDYLLDVILTRLRTKEGLDLDWIELNLGTDTLKNVLRGAELGLELNLAEKSKSILKLKDPEGFLFSNSIISSIFSELS